MSKVSVIVPVYNVENYIRGMLTSVQNQTFKDFEVVIINDGSPDNSQAIIDEFCAADPRFRSFVQENGGVAAARNNGIAKAEGDYVVFYDPDDYIPPEALEKLYKTAASKNADMVIGIMEEKSLGESLIYMHSQALAKQDRIDPMDPHFTGAWSLCHKMFSRKLIVDNGLKFEKLTNAEDGVFTYCALNHAERIYGCRAVAYNYMKRPFWLEASATQTISSKYLEGLLASHDRILEEATRLADKHLDADSKEKYMRHLFERFIEGEMIKGYYRNIWRATDEIIARISERTDHYRQFITEKQWQEILARHKDLELEKGYMTPDVIAQIPVLSIIITADLTAEQLDLVMGSIYNQQLQRFEVLVPEKYEEMLHEGYLSKANLRIIAADSKTESVKEAKGRYVTFIDEYALYTKNSLLNMVNRLEAGGPDFVSMLMKHYDGDQFSQIPCLNGAYGYTKKSKTSYNKMTQCDSLFSNKVFRKAVIEDFKFTDEPVNDIEMFFRTLKFEKMRKGVMITDMTHDEILYRSGSRLSAGAIRRASARNQYIHNVIEGMKRHINKNDIKKIKEKLRRK